MTALISVWRGKRLWANNWHNAIIIQETNSMCIQCWYEQITCQLADIPDWHGWLHSKQLITTLFMDNVQLRERNYKAMQGKWSTVFAVQLAWRNEIRTQFPLANHTGQWQRTFSWQLLSWFRIVPHRNLQDLEVHEKHYLQVTTQFLTCLLIILHEKNQV